MIHFLSDYRSLNNFILLLVGIEFSFSLSPPAPLCDKEHFFSILRKVSLQTLTRMKLD